MNSFGEIFRFSSFGESHGSAIGGLIDGCPAGLRLDLEDVQLQLDRRKPGQRAGTSERKEEDRVEILSGLKDGITTAAPIGFIIRNKNHRSEDYTALKEIYRPSHADYSYEAKWGVRDYRGGGRASARETACRVVAGAVARQLLAAEGVQLISYVVSLGPYALPHFYPEVLSASAIEEDPLRCPCPKTSKLMQQYLQQIQAEANSVGGSIATVVKGVPAGWGEPLYAKLNAKLAAAMFSIPACRGFEQGSGFHGCHRTGAEENDAFSLSEKHELRCLSNHSGGIQGGISNGERICFRLAFKPTSSIAQQQQTVSRDLKTVSLQIQGRHDPCILLRAVPVVEAMTALVLVDAMLLHRCSRV